MTNIKGRSQRGREDRLDTEVEYMKWGQVHLLGHSREETERLN